VTEKLNLKNMEIAAKRSETTSKVIYLEIQSNISISKLVNTQQWLSTSEGYLLSVQLATQQVVVTGTSPAGVFYGLQSMLSLLAASTDGQTLPVVSIISWIK